MKEKIKYIGLLVWKIVTSCQPKGEETLLPFIDLRKKIFEKTNCCAKK